MTSGALLDMEFRDLTYFLEVANLSHIGRAAARLGITQPALTKCVGRLERDVGVPLLERTGKRITLTACGLDLVRHAERLRAADVDIRRELAERATGHAGHLRIGTGFVLAQYLLPVACVTLLKKYPAITLEVVTGDSETLFPALHEGKIDVVLAGVDAQPVHGFRQVPLMEDRVVVISRKGHALQKRRRISAAALSQERWALPAPGTLPAQWLAHRWRELNLTPPKCAVRSGSLPTLLRIVAETDLLMFQSWSTVKRTNDYGELLRPLPANELTWRHSVGVTLRDHGYRSPAIDRFVEVLKETARKESS
ncbi:MAG: LysR family transcriptional regulator [Betaproteobacteria bacterium]|nr:LysR family transcriptional regulator [Betaproteobacteria bacterium]